MSCRKEKEQTIENTYFKMEMQKFARVDEMTGEELLTDY